MTAPTSGRLIGFWMVADMSLYDETGRFPQRKHPRLRYYDYSRPNYYFITICTAQKAHIFGQPGGTNRYGQIALEAFTEVQRHFPGVKIDQAVIMPNHVHAIFILTESDTNLSVVVGQYKAYVTKQIRVLNPGMKVWQTSFHDHVIRNQSEYQRIWNYIEGNPGKWQEDCFYTD